MHQPSSHGGAWSTGPRQAPSPPHLRRLCCPRLCPGRSTRRRRYNPVYPFVGVRGRAMNASREPVGRSDAERRARIDLAACHRLAARFGFSEGIDNHMTMLVPGHSERFYLAPFGLLWSEVKASDLLELDFTGTVVAGSGLVEDTALYIHLSVHRLIPQARCVLHTHMPHATALSMLEDPRLVMARSAAQAFERLYFLERACQAQVLALSTGRKLRIVPQSVVQATVAQFRAGESVGGEERTELHFQALKRLLDRSEADYAS